MMRRTSRPTADALGHGLAGLAILAQFTISSMTLEHLGLAYMSPGGSPFSKFHPASYFACAALAVRLLRGGLGSGIALVDGLFAAYKGIAAFVAAWGLLLLYTILALKLPVTPLIDTFLVPIVFFVLLHDLDERRRRRLAWFIHAVLLGNALLGIYEFTTSWRLTPFVISGNELTYEWRSTALLGHPLANAFATGAYLLALATGGGRDLPSWLRLTIFAICCVALATFAGRTATFVTLGLLGLIGARKAVDIARGAPFRPMEALLGLAVLLAAAVAIVALLEASFFDKFLKRVFDDDGSAKARVVMWEMFAAVDWHGLLFGPDPEVIATQQRQHGIEVGIESFWVAFTLQYGLIVSVPFFAAFLWLLWDLYRASRPASVWIFIYFLFAISASLSLSAKASWLPILVCLLMVLLPGTRAAHGAAGWQFHRIGPGGGAADPPTNRASAKLG